MNGALSLDAVTPYTYITGTKAYLVTCGECATRAKQYDTGNRERADFSRPWIWDGSESDARRTLARHNALHH